MSGVAIHTHGHASTVENRCCLLCMLLMHTLYSTCSAIRNGVSSPHCSASGNLRFKPALWPLIRPGGFTFRICGMLVLSVFTRYILYICPRAKCRWLLTLIGANLMVYLHIIWLVARCHEYNGLCYRSIELFQQTKRWVCERPIFPYAWYTFNFF